MIESVAFKNFKALRDCTLPLGQFTLIVGPNGSGKSTALLGLQMWGNVPGFNWRTAISVGPSPEKGGFDVTFRCPGRIGVLEASRTCRNGEFSGSSRWVEGRKVDGEEEKQLLEILHGVRAYSLDAARIAEAVRLQPRAEIEPDGHNLVNVLDRLRDEHPERFEEVNLHVGKWLPEFDRVLFETPSSGNRSLQLRTRVGQYAIPSTELSQGTLIALAMLTLAHLPAPPPVVCLEEPGRGIHPRLLRDVRDAIYRLAYPESCGESRRAVQVVATTHSPYLLDLFREHPEEIVLAEKLVEEQNVRFTRLSDRQDLDEILRDTHLGDAWYSGVLGGVPAE